MSSGQRIDGILVQWGERLFYPSNRIVKADPPPRLDTMTRRKAAVIRARIAATVRRVPQVMVKVTGGGRGMGAIAAHCRYISKNGRLDIEDAVCRQRHQRLVWVLVPSSAVASTETRRIARPSDRSPRLRPHAIDQQQTNESLTSAPNSSR